ncbi:MAG: hypothetical protein EXX96DRAFT_617409 [Benjaminiella poitrasii]|nr:MAG: hypothetical protein EXX96DRAFT_617409 [Benjaminiella poitrasii]
MKGFQYVVSETNTWREMHLLSFDIIYADGGELGPMYRLHNILLDNGSVYCSRRIGAVNILTQYSGYVYSGIIADRSCTLCKMIIRAPLFGFTAPCKEGLIFISDKEINVSDTAKFDNFTKQDYVDYVKIKKRSQGREDDSDPVAWFSLADENHKTTVVDLDSKHGKYVLIKLLRPESRTGSVENIDIQYVGFLGYSGPNAFGAGKLC